MFKSLVLKPSEDQIRAHGEQTRLRDGWRSQCERMKAILGNLDKAYRGHKEDFALGRYEELKNMIKDSVEEYKGILEENRQMTSGAASGISSKYGGNGDGSGAKKSGGLMSKIRKSAASLASFGSSSPASSQADSGSCNLTSRQIDEEKSSMRKEVLKLKVEFREARDKLEKLSREYESSKKFTPPQRYPVMKEMIKNATRPGGA